MSFRPVEQTDYVEYHSLINEFRPTTFTRDLFKEILEHIRRNGNIWVYEDEGKLLATATIYYERKLIANGSTYAHIEDVCVRSSHRRHGIGKKIIRHLIDISPHCRKITLDCIDSNVEFYESCGLERKGNQMCLYIEN